MLEHTEPTGQSDPVSTRPVRASISFPQDLYDKITELATQSRVSVAWIVRDAVERYTTEPPVGPVMQRR